MLKTRGSGITFGEECRDRIITGGEIEVWLTLRGILPDEMLHYNALLKYQDTLPSSCYHFKLRCRSSELQLLRTFQPTPIR